MRIKTSRMSSMPYILGASASSAPLPPHRSSPCLQQQQPPRDALRRVSAPGLTSPVDSDGRSVALRRVDVHPPALPCAVRVLALFLRLLLVRTPASAAPGSHQCPSCARFRAGCACAKCTGWRVSASRPPAFRRVRRDRLAMHSSLRHLSASSKTLYRVLPSAIGAARYGMTAITSHLSSLVPIWLAQMSTRSTGMMFCSFTILSKRRFIPGLGPKERFYVGLVAGDDKDKLADVVAEVLHQLCRRSELSSLSPPLSPSWYASSRKMTRSLPGRMACSIPRPSGPCTRRSARPASRRAATARRCAAACRSSQRRGPADSPSASCRRRTTEQRNVAKRRRFGALGLLAPICEVRPQVALEVDKQALVVFNRNGLRSLRHSAAHALRQHQELRHRRVEQRPRARVLLPHGQNLLLF